jgi:hypothetical protein
MTDPLIANEVSALWAELFGEPPPVRDDGSTMLRVLLESLPDVGYDGFAGGRLDGGGVVLPRGR